MTLSTLLRHPRLLVLGASHCLLLGFLTHLLLQPPRLPVLPKSSAVSLPEVPLPAGGNAADVSNAEDLYAALTSQPVLHTSRQLVPDHPVPTVPESPPPAYILTGYLGLPGRAAHAFLQPTSGGRTLIVGLGESVDGWSVVGLNPRQVELKQGDRSVSISKDGSSQNQATAPSAPAPATAPVAATAPTGGPLPSVSSRPAAPGVGLSPVPDKAGKLVPKPVPSTPKGPVRFFSAPHTAAPPHS